MIFLPASVSEFQRYVVAGVLPCVAMLLVVLSLTFLERQTYRLIIRIDFLGLRHKNLFWLLSLTAWVAGIGLLPNAKLALLHMVNGAALLILLWSLSLKDIRPLLVSWFPLAVLTVPMLIDMYPPASWWGRSTHLYYFRSSRPVIGPGGRLAPNLDQYMVGVDTPTPRHLVTNSWGFRNVDEFEMQKPHDELRILNLGDSYSIGYHLDQSGFLGSLLESNLQSRTTQNKVRVLNAAVSDPAYGLYYLQHQGLSFEPDLVLYGLCGNDFVQAYAFAGPKQRFVLDQDGQLDLNSKYTPANFQNPVSRFRNYTYSSLPGASLERKKKTSGTIPLAVFNPWRGFLQLRSTRYLLRLLRLNNYPSIRNYEFVSETEARERNKRLIDGFPNIGFFVRKDTEPVTELYKTTFSLLLGMKRTCEMKNIPYVIVYYPSPFQVMSDEWQRLCKEWGLRPSDFDLRKHNRKLAEFCQSNGINFVDATKLFENYPKPRLLYLPGDAHLTELAHEILAEKTANIVTDLLELQSSQIRLSGVPPLAK